MEVRHTCRVVAWSLLLSASASAQSALQPSAVDENISEKVINPISFLMRFTVETKYSPSLWDSRGEENEVEGQFVIPFEAFAKQNLARIKIFFKTSAPEGTHGLSDAELLDLVLFPRGRRTFGIGLAARLDAETPNRLGTVAPGPSVGAVIKHGKWKSGFLNQNFLSGSFAHTQFQPILAYAFDRKWSAEIGDAQYTYDWKKHRVTALPLSGQLNRVLSWDGEYIHVFFRAQYNLKNESGANMWTLTAGVSLIPKQREH